MLKDAVAMLAFLFSVTETLASPKLDPVFQTRAVCPILVVPAPAPLRRLCMALDDGSQYGVVGRRMSDRHFSSTGTSLTVSCVDHILFHNSLAGIHDRERESDSYLLFPPSSTRIGL
jgi:hypothetical protein